MKKQEDKTRNMRKVRGKGKHGNKTTKCSDRPTAQNSKSDRDASQFKNEKEMIPKSNDPNWWNSSITFSDAARVPFNVIPGYCYDVDRVLPTHIFDGTVKSDETIPAATALPGLMTINYVPIPGPANNWNDPVNKSWMSVFSAYASRTSGTMQIQQSDLALVGEAANSIITLICEVERALGIANLYSNVNQYLPKSLLKAALIDPDTVIGHQDDIRRMLNYYIGAFNALNLPGYTNIHLRRAQLASNVYADEDDVRAMYYMYVTRGYYQYIDTADEISDAEHLKWFSLNNFDRNVNTIVDAIGDCINALRNSSSFGLVSAAVLRAFGDRQLLRLDPVGLDHIVIPTVDRMMTYQTQNADFIGGVGNLDVTTNVIGNALVCEPSVPTSSAYYHNSVLTLGEREKWLNSFDGIIDSDFIIEGTRLKLASTALHDPGWNYGDDIPVDVAGTEICLHYLIWYMRRDSTTSEPVLTAETFTSWDTNTLSDAAVAQKTMKRLNILSKCNNHPFYSYCMETDATVHVGAVSLYPIGNFYRYTLLDDNALKGLHETALQSIYTLNPAIDVSEK